MSAVVSYPMVFLMRPCDEALIHELSARGVPAESASLMCFLAWRHFAMGGSGRIQLPDGGDPCSSPRALSVERACGWSGASGEFVRVALACGFFAMESSVTGASLVCCGFQEVNRGKAQSIQRSGALAKALKAHLREAEVAIQQKEELWSRTGGGAFEGLPPERRRSAMVFLMRVCRALSRSLPSDAVLSNGTIHMAAKCLEDYGDSVDATLFWVFDNRTVIDLPDRLDDIIREWPEYTRRAEESKGGG